ncbi:saccharopine dehydrogenase [bacterium (Candidatus Blackallbacteria) CG17_big_fil_post_rev_8_21_14_2_50_48_46]|uniref:Saccharopine dehydrogenase n=1 Tax=bacterium (Candidatus Blackallbacteria) CG17_big_fil_post_rev_8_21_14_2_50_48_46 TaxID=2014261 RepID=A0A2M7FYZ4_9BACT|nr:MAG: saccharopine dehydrogenase [bacterium (Candidatus Blackallbacteria) CG18_big_fil_WC_8_21_14_2_50_49_26]PIW14567.1 MAG: saccharopine dehydrogenase [bacterium (Candidatus Blackallbacteria) CG17_big_fil_post_rev_8_21_14_2_50_48_46]PIW47252.1 MAG: saccharopine dehydrogenase [bacterium (Candidatus Blackallbacteria) CG13_big_fil_rev_8_21_14_2_50_49_14]
MGYTYVVLGAGIQGTTIAYDMARFGEAEKVMLLDMSLEQAQKSAEHINRLLEKPLVEAGSIDVRNREQLLAALQPADSCLSAVPYFLNPEIAACAVEAKTNFCDLGGNTDVVFQELALHEKALTAGVSVIPDCGLAPGLGNTLAAHGIGQLDQCDEVQVRCGGLPQNPQPPLDYMLVFSVEGLTNEYFGEAVILRDGKIDKVKTFAEHELLQLPAPLGECEAFTTSGGTSTCPWTFEGQVKTYEYKTIRYKGHYEKMKVMHDLGLLDLEAIEVDGQQVIPRHVFHAAALKKLNFPGEKDLVVLRATCKGSRDGQAKTLEYTIVDFFDESTGFNAMSRMTGYPASIVAIMMARGQTERGAIPLEKSVPTAPFLEELALRGIKLQIQES